MTDRIIIYRLGSLGDTVAALPCFHLIERAYPDSERIVLTNVPVSSKAPPLESILSPGGFIHASVPYPLGLRNPIALARLAKRLRAQEAHTLVYLAASRGLATARRDAMFFRTCGFKRIIGAPLTEKLQRHEIDAAGNLERESHRLARALRSLGTIDFENRAWWDLRLTTEEYAAADSALGDLGTRRFVAVNTGGKAKQKDWGTQAWGALLRELSDQLDDWALVFVGSLDDQERAAELAPIWPRPVLGLSGRLSPRESAAALSRASLFIGHDSGALHLADAVGTPAVGLFGDYNKPKQWHPSGATTRVIHRMSGIQDISVGQVLAEVSPLIPTTELSENLG